MLDREQGQCLREQTRRDRRPHATDQSCGDSVLGAFESGRGAFHRAEDLLGVFGEDETGLGELHPAAMSHEKSCADVSFE